MGPTSRVPQPVPAPEDKSRSRKLRSVVVEIPTPPRRNIPKSVPVSDSSSSSSVSLPSNIPTSKENKTPRVELKDLGDKESDDEFSDDEDVDPRMSKPSSEKRPFDEVLPIVRPPVPSEHIKARSDMVPTKNITPDMAKEDLLKHKAVSRGVPIVADDPKSRTSPNALGNKQVRFKGTDEDVATDLCRSEVSLSIEEVAAISPSVRKILMRKLRNRQVSGKPAKTFFSELASYRRSSEPLEYKPVLSEHSLVIDVEDIALEEVFEVLTEPRGKLPEGAVVQRDPVETYQQDVPEGKRKDVIIVASNSDNLRVVFPKINGSNEEVENVKDCGSQIVVMSTLVAVGLGVSWDPTVTLHMQSANGQLKSTKGIARNVPFEFGDITVFLQVHIVDDPPFQVLLGRPFDVLTSSVIENFPDGEQYITVTCPNSGRKCTIGTYPRGMGKKIRARKEPTLVPMNGNAGAEKRQEEEPKTEETAANFQTPSRI